MGHGAYALAIFVAPLLFAALLEGALDLVSDRVARRAFIVGGLFGLAASLVLCAVASSTWLLSVGLTLAGVTSGAACGAAQAELVEIYRDGERAMARWTLVAAIGDVASPLVVTAALALGGSFRVAMYLVAALVFVQALAVLRRDVTATPVEDDEPIARLQLRAMKPRLWAWLFGASLCTLLDELVAALVALHAKLDMGSTEAAAAACMTSFAVGSVLGAAAIERALPRVSGMRLLPASALVSAVALGLVLLAPSVPLLAVALVLLGAAAAAHYPLTKAAAYAVLPGNPGLVNAASQIFVIVEIAAPLVVGAVADSFGLSIAIAGLVLQPVGVFVLALLIGRDAPTDDAS